MSDAVDDAAAKLEARLVAIEYLVTDLYSHYFRKTGGVAEAERWVAIVDKKFAAISYPRLGWAESDHRSDLARQHVRLLASDVLAKLSRPR